MDLDITNAAIEGFGSRLRRVRADQWTASTPDAEWDVRTLVNHVVGELLWIPPLVEGKTIAEVGNQFDGDVLGDDPVATFERAAAGVRTAIGPPGALDRTVHLSYGDFPGHEYLGQVTSDIVIHTWDLAKAIGADATLGDALVTAVTDFLSPQIDMWRMPGVFAAPVETGAGAHAQDRLIAMTGRDPDWNG
jgi:uncharacterized protein (TIGR03086 family)